MHALHITQLENHYRLRASERELKRTLDEALLEAIEAHLPVALQLLGIGEQEQVCIRTLQLPLRWRQRYTVGENSQQWGRQLVAVIEQELASGGGNIVRYASRRSALLDMANAIAVRDTRRVWAWNQLGIASLRDNCTAMQAAQQLMSALLREPAQIVPVLISLAKRQRLMALLSQFDCSQIDTLWQSWMRHCGIAPRWLQGDVEHVATDATFEIANRSAVLRELRNPAARAALAPRHASLLVAIEIAPHVFMQSMAHATALLTQIDQCLAGIAQYTLADEHGEPVQVRMAATSDEAAATAKPPAEVHAVQRQDNSQSRKAGAVDNFSRSEESRLRRAHGLNTPRADTQPLPQQQTTQHAEAAQLTEATHRTKTMQRTETAGRTEAASPHREQPQQESMESAQEQGAVFSDYGGLFLLLRLFAQRDLVRALINEPALKDRPLSWLLCELCQCLLQLPLQDAALKLFCGLTPAEPWPLRGEDALTTAIERSVLQQYANVITTALTDLLRWPQASTTLVVRLIRRPVRLLDDGGWLEVIFALRDIDTDVRRAALDLNPDYVPWLGKVVKIRYE